MRNSIARAFLVAMVSFVPVLAAVLSFVRIHIYIILLFTYYITLLPRSLML